VQEYHDNFGCEREELLNNKIRAVWRFLGQTNPGTCSTVHFAQRLSGNCGESEASCRLTLLGCKESVQDQSSRDSVKNTPQRRILETKRAGGYAAIDHVQELMDEKAQSIGWGDFQRSF
jgi:hypothetical protein